MYIENILILDLIIHLAFCEIIRFSLDLKWNWLGALISSLVNLIYMVLYLYFPKYFDGLSYVFGVILIFIFLFKENFKNKMKGLIYYYLLNFCLGGSSEILYLSSKITSFKLIIELIVICIIVAVFVYLKRYPSTKKLIYMIKVVDKEKKYKIKGFLDTGNFLIDDGNHPVVFLNTKYLCGKKTNSITISKVEAAHKIELYQVDCFEIKIGKKYIKKNVMISFTPLHFDCMFGLSLLEG